MSFVRLQQAQAESEELKLKQDQYGELLTERGDSMKSEEKNAVQKILKSWEDKQVILAQEIATLLPKAAADLSVLLRGQVIIRPGKTNELKELLHGNTPLSAAFQQGIVSQNFDIGSTDEEGEEAMERADALSDAIAFESVYPQFGAAILKILGNLEDGDGASAIDTDSATTEATPVHSSSIDRARSLITGSRETAISTIASSSANVATDLIELKETDPELVMGFLRSLPPDARTEIFEPGLALGQRSSLFLFDVGEVAAQIEKRFEQDVLGNAGSVNALSIVAELVEAAEDALQENDPSALGHVFGVLASIGYVRSKKAAENALQKKDPNEFAPVHGLLNEIINHNYSKKGIARSGDVIHAEHVKDAVREFVDRFEGEISSLRGEIVQIVDLTQPLEVAEGGEAPVLTTDDRIKKIAVEAAEHAIEAAADAFNEVDLEG